MWAEAAKHVAKFPEGIVTGADAAGFPVSVRQVELRYDAATGAMPVTLPDTVGMIPGPANLLCHFHDDQLWNQRMVTLKGRLERRGGGWVFQTTAFAPPSMWQMMKGMRASTKKYLAQRNLPWPEVDFSVIAGLWQDAKKIQDP